MCLHLKKNLSVLAVLLATVAGAASTPAKAEADQAKCKKTKVAILGAGMAGIEAAYTLNEKGITDFIIIEGQSEIGGRLHHTSFGKDPKSGNPYTVELGANWVQGLTNEDTGAENPIWTLAKKHKIKTVLTDFDDLKTFTEDGPKDFTDVIDKYEKIADEVGDDAEERMKKGLPDRSFREAQEELGWDPKTSIEKTSEWYTFDNDFATSSAEVSEFGAALDDASYVEWSDDNKMSVDQRGFSALVKGEAAEFLKGDDDPRLMLDSWVSAVNYTDTGVTIETEDGSCVQADYAICTFSLGVLQHEQDNIFSPEFPAWKKDAINAFKMATYTKIFIQFPKKFWDSKYSLYADPKTRGYYPMYNSLDEEDLFPGSGLLLVTICAEESYRVEKQDDKKTQEEILAVLGNMYPDIDIPKPTAFTYPRWTQERWARGSYSSWPTGVPTKQHDNLRANVGRLYFAGEHISEKYSGFIQGAYFEGKKAGENVASFINGDKDPGLTHYTNLTLSSQDNQNQNSSSSSKSAGCKNSSTKSVRITKK